MNRVTIRTKKKNKGTMLSVFLEYNPVFVNPKGEEVRYEFLNLEKYFQLMNSTCSVVSCAALKIGIQEMILFAGKNRVGAH